MTKLFLHIKVGQKFKFGGVGFIKTELADCGPFRVNARLDKAGVISEGDRYFFAWTDEVEV